MNLCGYKKKDVGLYIHVAENGVSCWTLEKSMDKAIAKSWAEKSDLMDSLRLEWGQGLSLHSYVEQVVINDDGDLTTVPLWESQKAYPRFNVYEDGFFVGSIVAENPTEALRIAANLSADCEQYGLDIASMRFSIVDETKDTEVLS